MSKNNGVITAAECRREGINSTYLTQLVREGILNRSARGLYSSTAVMQDEEFIFQYRHKRCIFSYGSALSLHGMIDHLPGIMEVTVYRGYNAHRIPKQVRVHYVIKDIYPLGIIQVETMFGNMVDVYDLERTLCDLIKNRAEIEGDIFAQSLRNYLKHPKKDLSQLFAYAKEMKILQQTQEIIEVMIE